MTELVSEWETETIQVASGVYAYVQGGGPGRDNTCVGNAGFVSSDGSVVAIDSLTITSQTGPFLAAIEDACGTAAGSLINTHHHNDHTYGNCLFGDVAIVAHERCREQMLLRGLDRASLPAGACWDDGLAGLSLALPTVTFAERLSVFAGDLELELRYTGVGHTVDDIIVYVPSEHVLFAGDLVFNQVTPLAISGSVGGWLRALTDLRTLDIETVVPGHGPVTDLAGIDAMEEYLGLVESAANDGYDAGDDVVEVARGIDLGRYDQWINPERLAANVLGVYRERRGEPAGTVEIDELRSVIGRFAAASGA